MIFNLKIKNKLNVSNDLYCELVKNNTNRTKKLGKGHILIKSVISKYKY